MSNSQALIALRGSLAAEDVVNGWPGYRATGAAHSFETWDEAYEWSMSRDYYLRGSAPDVVKVFYRDDDWTVLCDLSMIMVACASHMALLSRTVGPILLAVTQGTAGFLLFQKFQDGALRREIRWIDGDLQTRGAPLAEEAGVELEPHFDLDKLWVAHGLSGLVFDATMRDIRCIPAIENLDELFPRGADAGG